MPSELLPDLYAVNFDLGFATVQFLPIWWHHTPSCLGIWTLLPQLLSFLPVVTMWLSSVTHLPLNTVTLRARPTAQPGPMWCTSLRIFIRDGWLEILGDIAPEKYGQYFRWQWRKSLKMGPLSKIHGPWIEKPYAGHVTWALLSPASPAPGRLTWAYSALLLHQFGVLCIQVWSKECISSSG